jgi:hypothetical protein
VIESTFGFARWIIAKPRRTRATRIADRRQISRVEQNKSPLALGHYTASEIPHLSQPEGLGACLDSLDAQTLERFCFEVIVADNGSNSTPAPVIARHPGVRLVTEERPVRGLARNSGVRAANGDVFCFIDADCRAHPDWLRVAFSTMASAPDRTILGGDVQIWRGPNVPLTSIAAYESVFAYMQKAYIETWIFRNRQSCGAAGRFRAHRSFRRNSGGGGHGLGPASPRGRVHLQICPRFNHLSSPAALIA